MDRYRDELTAQLQRGMQETFAVSIALMLQRALWIVAIAAVLIVMIPALPLRSRADAAPDPA
jgi:hypothetical protein